MMKYRIRVIRRQRRARPFRARTAAAVIATVVLTLLAAACSGGSPSSAGSGGSPHAGGSSSPSAVGYSRCMRSHGVPTFPDPESAGAIPKVSPQQLGVSSSHLRAVQSTCAYLLQPTQAQAQLALSGMWDFARCMRSHGVPNWPDPVTDRSGQPVFDLHGQVAPDSPQIETKSDECSQLLHSTPGQTGTVLCNGIDEDGCHHYG
jgi:hypothetical protein